jgi:hypothetical protein
VHACPQTIARNPVAQNVGLHAIRLCQKSDCRAPICAPRRSAHGRALHFAHKSERACPCLHKHSLAFHSIAFAATATATRRSRCYHKSYSVTCYHTTLPTYSSHNSIYHNTITNILPQYYQHTYNHNTITMFPNYLLPQYSPNTTTILPHPWPRPRPRPRPRQHGAQFGVCKSWFARNPAMHNFGLHATLCILFYLYMMNE